ncbi:MAG: APC family permease [Nocardioides sp.]
MSQTTNEGSTLGGSRKLTLIDAVAQSVGFMGPVFSIAFLVPLLVGLNASGKGAGVAAPLSVLLAAIGVLALGWIVAQYAKRIHAAGSLYDYVTDGLGPRVGGAAGYLYYTGILVLGAGLLVLIGGFIHDTLQAEFNKTPLSTTAWMFVVFVVIAVITYFGVALSTRAQLVLAMTSMAVVLIFFLHLIFTVHNDVGKAFNPSSSPQNLSGVLFGVLYGVLLFTGFETAANLGEETAHPKRDIPRAVLIAVLAIGGFYLIGAYAQIAGFHFSLDEIGKNAGAPLFALAAPHAAGGYGSVAVGRLLELVVALDMFAVLLGCSVAASRGFFALARDERMPKPLATVSRRGTPFNAMLVVMVFYVVTILITRFWTSLFALPETPHYFAVFAWGSTFGGFALACIYLLMALGALRGLRDHEQYGGVVAAAVLGILVTAGAIFGAVYKVASPTIWAPWTALIVLVLGFVLTYALPGKPGAGQRAVDEFAGLRPSEQDPQKL